MQSGFQELPDGRKYLSIVIPAFNEELRLLSTLESIYNYFKNKDCNYEIVIINDGSSDKTSEVALSNPEYVSYINLIELENNVGKGYSIKYGVENAKGDYIIYVDADGATPVEEIEKLMAKINDGFDIAIASRALKSSNVHDLWYRRLAGITFNLLIKLFLLRDFYDTQCGFKLFKADCAKKIFERIKVSGFGFDVEVLFIAKKLGYRIAEVPVTWNSIPGSKINLFIHSPIMFMSILKIKILDVLGVYRF